MRGRAAVYTGGLALPKDLEATIMSLSPSFVMLQDGAVVVREREAKPFLQIGGVTS
jgi:hypothetical protein